MAVSIDDLEDAMTITQVAEKLGYTYRNVQRLIASGEIEHLRIGVGRGRIMITRRALTDYLNRQNRRRVGATKKKAG